MTLRSTTRSNSDRGAQYVGRTTVQTVDDSKKMQELSINLHHDEKMDGVEHVHTYGLTSKVMPPDDSGQPEGIVSFVHGNRSHPIVHGIGDRRFRPTNLEDGEVKLHDHQDQYVHLKKDSVAIKGKDMTQDAGNITITAATKGNLA